MAKKSLPIGRLSVKLLFDIYENRIVLRLLVQKGKVYLKVIFPDCLCAFDFYIIFLWTVCDIQYIF